MKDRQACVSPQKILMSKISEDQGSSTPSWAYFILVVLLLKQANYISWQLSVETFALFLNSLGRMSIYVKLVIHSLTVLARHPWTMLRQTIQYEFSSVYGKIFFCWILIIKDKLTFFGKNLLFLNIAFFKKN